MTPPLYPPLHYILFRDMQQLQLEFLLNCSYLRSDKYIVRLTLTYYAIALDDLHVYIGNVTYMY